MKVIEYILPWKRSGKSKRRTRSCLEYRPRFEQLEDRCVPATLTISSTDVPKAITAGPHNSIIEITQAGTITDVNVQVNISHTRDEDLDVFLYAPDGTAVELFTDVGGSGDNFTNATLDDEAATSITVGTVPFSASYRPEGSLASLDGRGMTGQWRLGITDDDPLAESGILNAWSITLEYLEVPALSGPAGTTAETAPTFSWSQVQGAARYDIWIDDVTARQSALYRDQYVVGTNWDLPTALTPGHTYRWWVRALDAGGMAGPWSQGRAFYVALSSPTPAAATTVIASRPTLMWSAVSGAHHYDVWVDGLSTGQSQALRSQTVAGTSYTAGTALTPGRTYRWWVRAVGDDGSAGPWSSAQDFSIVALPQLRGPNFARSDGRPIFSWDPVQTAVRYDIWVDDVSTGQSAVLRDPSISTTFWQSSSQLVSGHRYRWWLRALDSTGTAGPWSTYADFVLDTFAPGGRTIDATPTFNWDPIAGAAGYDLWIDDLTAGRSQVILKPALSAASYTVNDSEKLVPGRTYLWWVRAILPTGSFGPWLPYRQFTVDPAVAPEVVDSVLNGTASSPAPALSWLPTAGAARYEVWIDDATTGQQQVVRNTSVTASTFAVTTPLATGHRYRWWVRSHSDSGEVGAWSRAGEFDQGGFGPVGGEFRVTSPTNLGGTPDIAMVASGDFVVVWDGGADFLARRFDAAGNPVGGQLQVNADTTANFRVDAQVAMDAAGNFVVVWESHDQDGDRGGVYGQRFDRDGNRLGSEFRVNSYTTGPQVQPVVAMESDGDLVVAWMSDRQDGNGYGIYGQRYDAAGNRSGAEFRVNDFTTGWQFNPDVAAMPDGGFIVVWGSTSQSGVHAQRYGVVGEPLGASFVVTDPSGGFGPAVATDGAGNFVVAWQRTMADGRTDVFARRFAGDGSALGSAVRVNMFTPGNQLFPQVAATPQGEFVVTWDSGGQDGDGSGAYARRFAASGPAGPEFRVNSHGGGNQGSPAIAADADGEFVLVWGSDGDPLPNRYQVYAQRLGFNRDASLPADGMLDTTPTFTWDDIAGADHYRLRIDDVTAGRIPIVDAMNLAGTSFTPTAALLPGHTYVASIETVRADGTTASWVTLAPLRIDPSVVPSGLNTGGGFYNGVPSSHLSWVPVVGAARYEISIDDVTTGQQGVLSETNVSGLSYWVPTPLVSGHRYRWWVRGHSDSGDVGAWSRAAEFTVTMGDAQSPSSERPRSIQEFPGELPPELLDWAAGRRKRDGFMAQATGNGPGTEDPDEPPAWGRESFDPELVDRLFSQAEPILPTRPQPPEITPESEVWSAEAIDSVFERDGRWLGVAAAGGVPLLAARRGRRRSSCISLHFIGGP